MYPARWGPSWAACQQWGRPRLCLVSVVFCHPCYHTRCCADRLRSTPSRGKRMYKQAAGLSAGWPIGLAVYGRVASMTSPRRRACGAKGKGREGLQIGRDREVPHFLRWGSHWAVKFVPPGKSVSVERTFSVRRRHSASVLQRATTTGPLPPTPTTRCPGVVRHLGNPAPRCTTRRSPEFLRAHPVAIVFSPSAPPTRSLFRGSPVPAPGALSFLSLQPWPKKRRPRMKKKTEAAAPTARRRPSRAPWRKSCVTLHPPLAAAPRWSRMTPPPTGRT